MKREPWKAPGAEPYIRLEHVTRKFGDFAAVDNVSLNIYRGEIFCLLGGSGCGKTTLLRMLAGFEEPTIGRIFIDGADMAGVPPYERPVNMMFQSYALFPHMTVEQNVGFGLKQEGLARNEITQRVEEMLGIVKLQGFERRKPHQLSGGQRQRVALARSLIKRPKLLLLDEPLGALDKKLREHTQFELLSIQERLGVTFVVVTHDQEEAMTLASRIGVMSQGRIVQVGTPHEIYEFPATRYVADFIGNVNLFEGPDAGAWTAVRPEKMYLSREAPEGAYNVLPGAIGEIAYLGETSVYLVHLESGKTVRVMQPNTFRHAEDGFSRGERVWVSWHESSAVVVTE